VLRAVGAPRSLLTRLVLGEAVLIALSAGILGTLMGLQGVLSGAASRQAAVWSGAFGAPAAAADPGGMGDGVRGDAGRGRARRVVRLARRQPRELLGAVKG